MHMCQYYIVRHVYRYDSGSFSGAELHSKSYPFFACIIMENDKTVQHSCRGGMQ